eukprot:22422-Eustigmatos_ZCMA.PRE.1
MTLDRSPLYNPRLMRTHWFIEIGFGAILSDTASDVGMYLWLRTSNRCESKNLAFARTASAASASFLASTST